MNHNEVFDNRPAQHGRVQEVIEGETVSLECHEDGTPGVRVRTQYLNDLNLNSYFVIESHDHCSLIANRAQMQFNEIFLTAELASRIW